MAKSSKPNGPKSTKATDQIEVPNDVATVGRQAVGSQDVGSQGVVPARILTTPANIVTGYIMYANSHYYYSLDCCVTGDQHTSVLVTTVAQIVYTCDDPNKQPINPTGSIEENFLAGEYSFAAIDPNTASRVSQLIAGPSASAVRRATVIIAPRTVSNQDVPQQLLRKVYGLFEVRFDGRTYAFLVYEQPATRLELEAQFIDLPRMDGAIFLGELAVGGSRYVVRGVVHD